MPFVENPNNKNYAVVDATGNVVLVVVWDGETPYDPSPGFRLVQSDVACAGWIYDGANFTNPNAG